MNRDRGRRRGRRGRRRLLPIALKTSHDEGVHQSVLRDLGRSRTPRHQLPVEGCRRLGGKSVSLEAAELACSGFSGGEKDRCIFDVIAMDDLEMAETSGAF